jgi:uroporphyrinogen-III synthase
MAVRDLRIWATRPAHQNAEWHETLAALGVPVVDLPLIVIEPVQEAAEIQAVKNLILNFDQFHKVIFVSHNAVREAFTWLRDYWPQLPDGVEYIAVGSKTAEAVMAESLPVTSGVRTMDSDELLGLPQLQNVWGEKILICRGRGGLPRMGEVLRERGAIVHYCELYYRRLPPTAVAQAAPLMPQCANDVIPVFSGETLQNLVKVLDANGVAERNMTLVVPGKRVCQEAEKLGFTHVITAVNAATATMLAAVQEALDRRAQL